MSRFPNREPDMTEAEWLECADPLRMPKQFRGRSTPRKRCLLACAYLLHAPGGLVGEAARRVVEAVRDAAFGEPPAWGLVDGTRAAVARALPECANLSHWTLWQWLRDHPEFGTDGGQLANFLRGCAFQSPSTACVNAVASACLATVRAAADREVRPVLQAVLDRHGRPVTEALKEDVFALIPEPERTRVRNGPWQHNWLPARVRNKVYAATSRPRMAAASVALAHLVREVFGNPFRPPEIEPEWLLWNHGAARHIAKQIAASGHFADLPILADALEDAGCTDDSLLQHMRSGTTHVPGCWALDAVLGR